MVYSHARINFSRKAEGAPGKPVAAAAAGAKPKTLATNGTGIPKTGAVPKVSSISRKSSISGSSTNLNKSSPGSSSTNMTPDSGVSTPVVKHIKCGDRVMVSGTKPGTLRYLGETDFAKGVWAGVELDDELGKNDGAVAGKR